MFTLKKEQPIVEQAVPDFSPLRVVEVELGAATFPPITATAAQDTLPYRYALCLVRLHTQPIGIVHLPLDTTDGITAPAYLTYIWDALGEQINAHLRLDGLPLVDGLSLAGLPCHSLPACLAARSQFLRAAPFVSIIVATHERAALLQTCLRSLLALDYPDYEIIVVDNAPTSSATAAMIQLAYAHEPRIRLLCEERRGVTWARNCGINAARGSIIAIADDDIVADRHWLTELVRPFRLSANVACVSGLILPLKLDTPAQVWFEEYGGFNRGFSQRIYDLAEHNPHTPAYPYHAGAFGAGASVAFTAQFLREVGGFDRVLGNGNPVAAGEDIALFFQVIHRGYQLVYTPGSLAFHLHRTDYAGLRKQIYHYGIGLTAYFTKNIVDEPALLLDFASKIPYGFLMLLKAKFVKPAPKTVTSGNKTLHRSALYPRELSTIELKGMLYGPIAYLQGRRRLRKQKNI